jgi:hypothetical protein
MSQGGEGVTTEVIPLHNVPNSATLLILLRAQGLYADLRDELTRADPEADEYRCLLPNFSSDLDCFIFRMERLQDGGA